MVPFLIRCRSISAIFGSNWVPFILFNFIHDTLFGQFLSVDTIGIHGIKGIGHTDHAGDQRDVWDLIS